MSDALYLLDGYSLVYRSYFAFIRTPMFNPKGKNSSAIFGFFRSLFLLLEDRRPSHFAVVLDSRTPTFRHEMYEEYKATREKTPEDLKNEIPVIEEILEKLGVPTVRVDGYEADDVMATFAAMAKEAGTTCYVVSGDKDLLQLVDGPVKVLKPESGGGFTEMDRDAVVESWGVTPEQILDFLSLVGDSSDNVPGVKGIGAKTAASLLEQFPNLESIYEHLGEIKSKSQREKLETNRESAFLSRDLVTLEMKVPVDREIDDLRLGDLDRAAAAPYFAAEGMKSLVKEMTDSETLDLSDDDPAVQRAQLVASREMESWLDDRRATLDPSGATEEKAREAGRKSESGHGRSSAGPAGAGGGSGGGGGDAGSGSARRDARAADVERPALIGYERDAADAAPGTYELVDTVEALDRWCDRAREAGLIAFDSETTSLDSMRAEPVGFSIATERGSACYIALHGPDGPVLKADEVRARL
ncbi:MAG: 5'-3' exonuclease H3TH domain-containing protein, partial [Spirochaetota bacterium]